MNVLLSGIETSLLCKKKLLHVNAGECHFKTTRSQEQYKSDRKTYLQKVSKTRMKLLCWQIVSVSRQYQRIIGDVGIG